MTVYSGTIIGLANAGSGSDLTLFTFTGAPTSVAWTATNSPSKATLLANYSGTRFYSTLPSFGYFNFSAGSGPVTSVECPSGTLSVPSDIAWAPGTQLTEMCLGNFPKPTTFASSTFTAAPVCASKAGIGGGGF